MKVRQAAPPPADRGRPPVELTAPRIVEWLDDADEFDDPHEAHAVAVERYRHAVHAWYSDWCAGPEDDVAEVVDFDTAQRAKRAAARQGSTLEADVIRWARRVQVADDVVFVDE